MMDQILASRRAIAAAELAARAPFRLGSVEVRPAGLQLAGPAGSVHLEPRVMQVLLQLADSAGQTVTRAALFQQCWASTIVDDSALNRIIVQLRRRADEAGGDFRITTIPRVGYRLDVEPTSPGDTAAPDDLIPGRRRLLAAGFAGALAVAGLAGLGFRAGTNPDEAQAKLLHQRALTLLGDMTPARDAEAVALLQEATNLDAQDAGLFGTLALAYQRAAEMGPEADAPAAEARTREAAREALARDSGNADAQVATVLIMPVYRNWNAAERAQQDLLARFPDHVPLLAGHAKMLADVGRFDDAMSVMDRLFAIEPLGPAYHWRRALGLWAAGRPDAAMRLIERARRIWPADWGIWSTTFWLNAHTGSHARAMAVLNEPPAKTVPEPMRAFMRRSALLLSGADPSSVRETLLLNRQSAQANSSAAEQAMAVAAAIGAVDEAFALANAYHFGTGFAVADQRLAPGETMSPTRRKTLPLFWPPMAAARRDPRFDRLTASLGLDEYWRSSARQPDFIRRP
jgi:DNA-binding winged helix-turn-helix (wHTH) protein